MISSLFFRNIMRRSRWLCLIAANKYKVTVYTGTESKAGTDANVRIILFGDLGISGEKILNDKMEDNFENGS